jgi:two-component system KDP operon response regulator KdpE
MTKGSILVISNEMNISRALRITLAAKGYKVTNTRTVTEAVNLSESAKHDLILLDNDSSSSTATEACREIRACSAAAIIIMGSETSEEKKAHAILAGADSYMPKPFGVAQIFADVRAIMRKNKAMSDLGVLVS